MLRKEIISYLGAKPVLPALTLSLRGCDVGLKGKYLFFRVSEIDLKTVCLVQFPMGSYTSVCSHSTAGSSLFWRSAIKTCRNLCNVGSS